MFFFKFIFMFMYFHRFLFFVISILQRIYVLQHGHEFKMRLGSFEKYIRNVMVDGHQQGENLR